MKAMAGKWYHASALALAWFWLVCPAEGAETAALDRWLATQTNLHSWTADFVQTRHLKSLAQPLRTPGRVVFQAPDRFRWELGEPVETIALRQTNRLWVIYPRQKRAEEYDLAKGSGSWRDTLALLEAGFPRSRAELEDRFRLTEILPDAGLATVTLTPRSAAARRVMPELRLGFATTDNSLCFTEMVLADGSRVRQDFTNAVVNPTWTSNPFEYLLPDDYQVARPQTTKSAR